jgi:hypothetical protein
MEKREQSRNFDIRQTLLIAYVGVCVVMVTLTLGLGFLDSNLLATGTTSTVSPTVSPRVLTLQAEGYEESEHPGQGRGEGSGTHEQLTPQVIPTAMPNS